MEIRKLQRTGGTSLTLTLPKKWVDKNNLQDKDLIQIMSPQPHILMLQASNGKKRTFQSTCHIDNLTDKMLTREIIAHYISGADEIIVQSLRISPEQRNKIRDLSNFLTGFELIDETAEKIILKNVFDPTKFPITKKIEKMFLVTTSMFTDVLKAIAQDDKKLAEDVIQRDFEIDKLHLTIKRQRHSLAQDKISQEEVALNLEDLHYYDDVATQLERIADHAVKIAKIVTSSSTLPTSYTAVIDNIAQKITLLLDKSSHMVKAMDKALAHDILDNTFDIKDTEKAFALHLFVDSLDRVYSYTTNIAELTLDHVIEKENNASLHKSEDIGKKDKDSDNN